MFYKIAHFFRDKLPLVWDIIEFINSFLFYMRFRKKIKLVEPVILSKYSEKCGMKVVRLQDIPSDRLECFFTAQPSDAYDYFKPHKFDYKSLRRLQNNRSFLAYVLVDNNDIAAYLFIRSYFIGKGFRGRMVGIDYRGRGLGTLMNNLMNDIGFGIGLRLFETVSKDNIASYRSALSASKVKILEELEDNELYLEILKD